MRRPPCAIRLDVRQPDDRQPDDRQQGDRTRVGHVVSAWQVSA